MIKSSKEQEIDMDTVTANKLEYIVSGTGLMRRNPEFNEALDLMVDFAKEHLSTKDKEIERLRGKTNFDTEEILRNKLESQSSLLKEMGEALSLMIGAFGTPSGYNLYPDALRRSETALDTYNKLKEE